VIGKGPLERRQEVLRENFGKRGVSNGVCHGKSSGVCLSFRTGRILLGIDISSIPFALEAGSERTPVSLS